jgi:hypothetical protein
MTSHPHGQKWMSSSEQDHCKAMDKEADGHIHGSLNNAEDSLLNHSKKHRGS